MSVCLLLLVVSKQRYSDIGILQAIALQDQLPPHPVYPLSQRILVAVITIGH